MEFTQVFREKITQWLNTLIAHTPNIVLALLVFFAGFYLSRKVRKIVLHLLARRELKLSARNMLSNIISVLVILLFFFIALNILNLNDMLKTLLAGAGVAGLAIGLALQGTLSNTFSGITLSFIKDLKIGDQVETNGYRGTIEDINLRVVTLRMADNNIVSIPNKMILESPFINYSFTSVSRVVLACGVAYDSDLELVRNLVLETLKNDMGSILNEEPVYFSYTEFADSSINFEVRFMVNARFVGEMAAAKSEAIIAIKKKFDAHHINIPFPIRTLDLPQALTAAIGEQAVSKKSG